MAQTELMLRFPRLVLPDGTVIMPKDVLRINLVENIIDYKHEHSDGISFYRTGGAIKVETARLDRPTYLPDKNGTMMFENDSGMMGITPVRILFKDGVGFCANPLGQCIPLDSYFCRQIEITGLVLYGEEK